MSEMRRFLLDTDIGPDCDDTAALALCVLYARQQQAQVLGVMHCTSSPWGVGTIRAVLDWYGASDIPVGTLYDPDLLNDPALERYNKPLALTVSPERREAEDCLPLYRKLLSEQPDGSVEIVSIGPLRNIGNLLSSAPDEFSPLSGEELVARKVKRLTMMAGNFTPGWDKPEWNVEMDIPSAQKIAERWPSEVVYCGWEVGFPVVVLKEPCALAENNPVRVAYKLYSKGVGRQSWDLCTVQWAMQPGCDVYTLSDPGVITIDDQGVTHYAPSAQGKHFYLSLKADPQTAIRSLEEELERFDSIHKEA